ncbi:hypothetical protein KEN51_CDS0068 [Pseudomonas phage vB_Pae10145-KEN51]|nr:hypothetical protein [Pseudomonas phage ANB1]WNV50345.1 hypothetical protein [Pseudomonas phage PhiPizzaParty]WRQ05926.1 hypothetical protein IPCDMZAV_CDS0404 [Pseudomonas phage 6B]WRQ06013.1 hypothetical protein QAMIJHJT_CDS0082 [Pseudomonas phage 9-Ps-8B]WRQ06421.1 hypothetical protein FOPPYZMZ_CDS0081 [Pseudomonas phage 9Ps-7B]WRQ06772.1 hypothetical protein ZBUARNPM_CDS0023 [Pseudomonas phage 14Ps5-6]
MVIILRGTNTCSNTICKEYPNRDLPDYLPSAFPSANEGAAEIPPIDNALPSGRALFRLSLFILL